jgi:hypothetical protein
LIIAAGSWILTNTARTKILDGTFASGSSWKVALFLSTSNIGVTSTTFAELTGQHAAANGYTSGGIAVTAVLSGTTSVTWSFVTNPVWSASGGPIAARYAVLYKVSSDDVLAYCLLDSTPADVTTTDGNTLTLDSDGAPGPVLTLS